MAAVNPPNPTELIHSQSIFELACLCFLSGLILSETTDPYSPAPTMTTLIPVGVGVDEDADPFNIAMIWSRAQADKAIQRSMIRFYLGIYGCM